MSGQLETLWQHIRDELRREVPDFKFHVWLEPLEPAGLTDSTLYVRAPEHIRTSVAERYLPLLRRVASGCADSSLALEVVGEDWDSDRDEGARIQAGAPLEPGLNPKYSFEQFVIGEGNRFAHAAALATAEMPAQAYNPLFLHGAPGLGKTHLLHAIGRYVHRYGGGLRVRYATIEEFTSEFVGAVREQRTEGFKDGFRNADVVLIDDVQFLAGRTRTREEFFHTFNALLDSGRQLVLTSDRPPEELPDLEDRLSERFRSGLVVELEPPGIDVREAILSKRARLDGVEVASDVLAEIAGSVTSSVRALEGALIRVVAYSSLRGQEPTPALVRHVLRRLGGKPSDGPCGIDRHPRRRRSRVRGRTNGPRGSRPASRGRHRTSGRHVPRARAHQPQPPRDRPRRRWAQPRDRHPCHQPRRGGRPHRSGPAHSRGQPAHGA